MRTSRLVRPFIFAQPSLRRRLCTSQTQPSSEFHFTVNVPTVDVYLKAANGGLVGEITELLCEVGSRFYVDEEVTRRASTLRPS